MVSHANLLANLEMIRLALGNTRQSTYVNWVPLYHDMGLILNALEALYIGATCVLMAPNAFMQRPLGWLRAISHYRAEVACSPNFGFDLCVSRYRADQMEGVDLSSLRIALNGAEPVHAETIERFVQTFASHGFDPRVMYPAYGMAEATLLISGGRRGDGHVTRSLSRAALQAHAAEAPSSAEDTQVAVGCGHALTGERIAIVDPESRTRLPADRVGEIWVNGANIARVAQRRGDARGAQCADCRRRRSVAAHRRPRLRRRHRRIVRHGTDQGPHHRPRHQPLSPGRRAHGAIARWSFARKLRRGVLGAGRDRRRGTRHRPGNRAHRASLDRHRSDQGPDSGGHRRQPRTLRAPHRADPARHPAEDHQRQDPTQAGAQALAR